MKKKMLKDESRIFRRPPEEVETRILLAARIAARMNRGTVRARRFNWLAAAGAAAVLAVGSILLVPAAPETARVGGTAHPAASAAPRENGGDPLQSVSDWSSFDREAYSLSCQLNSERNELADPAGDLYAI